MTDLRGGYRSEAARRPDAEWGERVLAGERLETLADLRWLPIPDLHARARHRLRHRRARHRVDRRQPRRVAACRGDGRAPRCVTRRRYFVIGVTSSLSAESTTKTASSFAGSVSLAFALMA
jgi:hypothetical protein